MQKTFLKVLIALLLFTSFASAQDYGIWLHNIDIDVASDGQANVTEKFHIFFTTDAAQFEFRQMSTEFGSNLVEWENFNSIFKSNIGGSRAVNKKINYSEGTDTFLEITYSLIEPIMAQGKETAFISEYSIKANYLNNLYDSGLWIIPENTRISIILPSGAEVNDNVKPVAAISNYTSNRRIVTWQGYKSSNELVFNYFIWKKIDPIIDLNKLSYFLFRTTEGLILIGIFIIIIGIIIWKRKFIADKIENFVESNTILKEN